MSEAFGGAVFFPLAEFVSPVKYCWLMSQTLKRSVMRIPGESSGDPEQLVALRVLESPAQHSARYQNHLKENQSSAMAKPAKGKMLAPTFLLAQ